MTLIQELKSKALAADHGRLWEFRCVLKDHRESRTLSVHRSLRDPKVFLLIRTSATSCVHQAFSITEDGTVYPDGGVWRFRVPQPFLKSIRGALA